MNYKIIMMSKFKLIIAISVFGFVWISLALIGCATTATNIKSAKKLSQVEKESSIVYGQIKWLEHGEEKNIGKKFLGMSVTPHLIKIEDKTRIIGEVSDGGQFVWSLEPGKYFIFKMQYQDPWSGNYFVVPKVAFDVPRNGKIYYIGMLKCEFEPKRNLIGMVSGGVEFSILDEDDIYISNFQERFSITANEIEKSLMIHDSRLPRAIETTKEFNLAVSIINALLLGI